MRIWTIENLTIEDLMLRGENTMADFLEISFISIGDNFLTAKMPITNRTKQPIGIMHGGASCVLSETVGSTAANYCVDRSKYYCVGLDINTNHIRSVKEGNVYATAKPFHLGRSSQVWGIEIINELQQIVSINRLTMSVLSKK